MTAKRLPTGKGIRVTSAWGDGEIVRAYRASDYREYEIRLGPAHFVYMKRKHFRLVDKVIPYSVLVKLRLTDPYR